MIFCHLEVLLVDGGEIVGINNLYDEYYGKDEYEDGADEAEPEADVGDGTNFCECLVILILKKDIFGRKEHDFIFLFIEL